MIKLIKDYIKTRPRLYDMFLKFSKPRDAADEFFDEFSKLLGRKVNFVQVGASDGLRWDPLRKHIIRDQWNGILIEPLPEVFKLLVKNYAHIKGRKLIFLNVAVSSSSSKETCFWTYSDEFLKSFPLEKKMYFLRKSSFNKDHLLRRSCCLKGLSESALKKITVPTLTINEVVTRHWRGRTVNLLVSDAEGHDAVIIRSIDFRVLNPEAIFFESHNLGREQKEEVYQFLRKNDYEIIELGGDSVAVKKWLISRFSSLMHPKTGI